MLISNLTTIPGYYRGLVLKKSYKIDSTNEGLEIFEKKLNEGFENSGINLFGLFGKSPVVIFADLQDS